MNQDNNRSCNYELLPLAVIEAAHAGDPSAMDRVLRHYDRYIKSSAPASSMMTADKNTTAWTST